MAFPNNEELAGLMLTNCRELMIPDDGVSDEELRENILEGLNSPDEPAAILLCRIARVLYDRGVADGWQSAIDCHTVHGMAGWSSHRDEYVKGTSG